MVEQWLERARKYWQRHIEVFEALKHIDYASTLESIAELVANMYRRNSQELYRRNRVVFFGNGGSFEQAAHLATEFTVRFQRERRSLEALALTCCEEYTAVANDYGFEHVFSRQLESKISRDDVAIGLTTSGSSLNVLYGLKKARELGAITVAFTGGNGIKDLKGVRAKKFVDYVFAVPLDPMQKENVALIQAAHLVAGHFICDYVDEMITDLDKRREAET